MDTKSTILHVSSIHRLPYYNREIIKISKSNTLTNDKEHKCSNKHHMLKPFTNMKPLQHVKNVKTLKQP